MYAELRVQHGVAPRVARVDEVRSGLLILGFGGRVGTGVREARVSDLATLELTAQQWGADPVTHAAARVFLREGTRDLTLWLVPTERAGTGSAVAVWDQIRARASDLRSAVGLLAGPALPVLCDGEALAAAQSVLLDVADRHDALALVDPPRSGTQLTRWGELLAERAAPHLGCGASWWPWLQGPAGVLPPGVHVGALMARLSEGSLGPGRAPANLPLPGALAPEGRVGAVELRQVGGCGMNVIRALPGVGVTPWGAVTLGHRQGLSAIVARRVYGIAVERLRQVGERALFEPVTSGLRGAVQRRAFSALQGMAAEGLLVAGPDDPGFFVRCEVSSAPSPQVRVYARLRPVASVDSVEVDVVLTA